MKKEYCDTYCGRLVLGLGAGWHQPEYQAFGYPFDHLAGRFEEAIQIIVPLLREGKVDFHGQYYEVDNCVLRPRGPSRNGPSILIAGRRPRMLQLTARYADAWNTAWHMEAKAAKERFEEFKGVCATVGRDISAIDLTVGTRIGLGGAVEEESDQKIISGTPEAIASSLQDFADEGTAHLIAGLNPLSVESIEQLGQIVKLQRQRQ